MGGESPLHILNRLSKVINYDSVLNDQFSECLNRQTGLYIKSYIKSSLSSSNCKGILYHIIARSILPSLNGGIAKQVYLFQFGGPFQVLKLVSFAEALIRNQKQGELFTNDEVESLIKESLKQLIIVDCVTIEEKIGYLKSLTQKIANMKVADVNHFVILNQFSIFHEYEMAKVSSVRSSFQKISCMLKY